MRGKLRPLSGADVLRILDGFGSRFVKQEGSHVKIRRITTAGQRETLHIPMHKELRTGTLRTIIRQASQYVPLDQLEPHFFTER